MRMIFVTDNGKLVKVLMDQKSAVAGSAAVFLQFEKSNSKLGAAGSLVQTGMPVDEQIDKLFKAFHLAQEATEVL